MRSTAASARRRRDDQITIRSASGRRAVSLQLPSAALALESGAASRLSGLVGAGGEAGIRATTAGGGGGGGAGGAGSCLGATGGRACTRAGDGLFAAPNPTPAPLPLPGAISPISILSFASRRGPSAAIAVC